MFCVQCGKEDVDTINGLCMECFLNGRKLVTMPHHVDLIKCSNCGEYSLGDQWLKMPQDDAIMDIAMSTVMMIPEAKLVSVGQMIERQDDKNFVVHVQFDLDVNGVMANDEDSTIVRLKNGVCKRCSRQLGSYYEAIIQLRSGERNLDEDLREEVVRHVRRSVDDMAKNNRDLFITKIQKAIGGVDFYLSSTAMARSITRELVDRYGAEEKESASLVGQTTDGQEMYRVTFLVRLPGYHVGDIVQYNNRPHLLSTVNRNGGRIIDLNTFRDIPVKRSELQDMKVLCKRDEIPETTVVSVSDKEIQVLHPRNYTTIDLRIPEGQEIGDTVKILELEEELFFVP